MTTPHRVKQRRYGAQTEERADEGRNIIGCRWENDEEKATQQGDSDDGQDQTATAIY